VPKTNIGSYVLANDLRSTC